MLADEHCIGSGSTVARRYDAGGTIANPFRIATAVASGSRMRAPSGSLQHRDCKRVPPLRGHVQSLTVAPFGLSSASWRPVSYSLSTVQ